MPFASSEQMSIQNPSKNKWFPCPSPHWIILLAQLQAVGVWGLFNSYCMCMSVGAEVTERTYLNIEKTEIFRQNGMKPKVKNVMLYSLARETFVICPIHHPSSIHLSLIQQPIHPSSIHHLFIHPNICVFYS